MSNDDEILENDIQYMLRGCDPHDAEARRHIARCIIAYVREHDGRDAERKERAAVRMLACLVRSAGGEIRVPRDIGLRNDLVIQRWDDFETDEIVITTQDAAERERLPCGHHHSLMLHSAETGRTLYCELCDDKSGRHDAERMEAELRIERDTLRAENERLRTSEREGWRHADELEQERKRLNDVIIEEAPHGKNCASIYAYEYPCNCWKAAALAEVQS